MNNHKLLYILGGGTLLSMWAALYAVFVYVPTERVMGIIQRIFYFHVALGTCTFLAFFVVFAASILFLWRKQSIWDIVAHSSAEIGVLFCSLVLITGPIWARPIWGVWWTWDSRLTTTLILWLIYVGYLMLRALTTNAHQRAKFAAVFGIVGFIDVPIVHMSIHWWRTIHPVVIKTSGIGLAPEMLNTMLICILAMLLLYGCLLWLRIAVGQAEFQLEEAKHNLSLSY